MKTFRLSGLFVNILYNALFFEIKISNFRKQLIIIQCNT